MIPLLLAAFAGLGVTRLTLLALQLSAEVSNQNAEGEGSNTTSRSSSSGNAEEEGIEGGYQQHQQPLTPRSSQEEEDRALDQVVCAMALLEKPVKMLQRGDFHFLCIWQEADFHPHMPEANLIRAAVARQELALAARQREEEALARVDSVSRSGFQQELFRTLQDMTAFFDQFVVGKTLEPLLRPPSAAAAGRGEMSEGRGGDMRAQTRRHAATGGGWLQLQEQEPEKEEEGGLEEEGFWWWWSGSKSAASSSSGVGGKQGHPDSTAAAAAAACDSSSMCSTGNKKGEERGICLVCYEREQDAVLLTCGHGGTCFKCACDVYRRSGECPLCRARVDQIVQIGHRRQSLPNGLAVVPVTGPWPTSASCW